MQVISRTEDSPLQFAAFKNHLRIYHDNDDAQIYQSLRAAQDSWDEETKRPIRTTTYKYESQSIPHGYCFGAGPVQSITSVTYNDADTKTDVTVDASNYRITYTGALPKLQFINDIQAANYNARWWEVTFTARGETTDDVARAVFMLGSTFYDERNTLAPVQLRSVAVGWATITQRYRWPAI